MSTQVRGRFAPLTESDLEVYLCGDASPSLAAQVEHAAQASAHLQAYLAERRADQAAFFALHPNFATHKTTPAKQAFWFITAAAALAGCLAVGLVFTRIGNEQAMQPSIQTRGGLKATLVVRRNHKTFAHQHGQALQPHDEVRIVLESPTQGYATVLGPGGDGTKTLYYDAVKITAGSFTLPYSLVLDDRVGEEEWLILLSSTPLPPAQALSWSENNESLQVAVVRILKEAP